MWRVQLLVAGSGDDGDEDKAAIYRFGLSSQ